MWTGLTVLLGKIVLVLLVLCGLAALALGRLRRRLRVSPRRPSEAPLRWLMSPLPAARLHRQLQGSVRGIRSATRARPRLRIVGRPPAPSPSLRLAADLEREAVAVDHRLVTAAHLAPGARNGALRDAAREVAQVAELARRIVELAHDERERPAIVGSDSALEDLAGRLDRLERARAELTIIEADGHSASPRGLSA